MLSNFPTDFKDTPISFKNPFFQQDNEGIGMKSGKIIIFHQPRFPWNKGISRNLGYLLGWKLIFSVAIIWPDERGKSLYCTVHHSASVEDVEDHHWSHYRSAWGWNMGILLRYSPRKQTCPLKNDAWKRHVFLSQIGVFSWKTCVNMVVGFQNRR